MNIEEKIQVLIVSYYDPHRKYGHVDVNYVKNWSWHPEYGPWSSYRNPPQVAHDIDKIIRDADPSICLTSCSEYIRECKKWYMENK